MNFIISLIFAYIACFGFALIFHIRHKLLYITPIGGVILWGVYLALETSVESVVVRTLIATMIAAIFCEIIARYMKVPVTVFMIIAILPLVPGSGIYYSMDAFINKDYNKFFLKGIETIGIAGAIAVGIIIIATFFKMGTTIKRRLIK